MVYTPFKKRLRFLFLGIFILTFPPHCFNSAKSLSSAARAEGDGWAAGDNVRYDFSITNVHATVTGATVQIAWESEYLSNAVVDWGLQNVGDNKITQNEHTKSHTVSLGILPEGRYRYRITSTTPEGLQATVDNIGNMWFEIHIYPQVSAINATTNQATRQMTVTWTTDIPTKGFLALGSTTALSDLSADEGDGNATVSHSITIEIPAYDTTFYYQLRSVDEQGDETVSNNAGAPYTVNIASPAPPPTPNGTQTLPYTINTSTIATTPVDYTHSADTSTSTQNFIDRYYPATQKEDGNEVYYTFTITKSVTFKAMLTVGGAPTATVDNDVHLLTDLSTVTNKPGADFNTFRTATLYNNSPSFRGDVNIPTSGTITLPAGTYYVVVDAFKNSSGTIKSGHFTLNVQMTEINAADITINIPSLPYVYTDSTHSTATGGTRSINYYPGYSQNESGSEYVYTFTVPVGKKYKVEAALSGMTGGTDIDIHLLSSLSPLTVLGRNDTALTQTLDAGTYYLVADTYVNASGVEKSGAYTLTVNFTDVTTPPVTNPVVAGYLTYWSTSTTSIQWDKLTHLIYFCLEPNADGSVKTTNGWETTAAVTTAKSHNVTVLLSVCLFGASNIATMVNIPSNSTRMVNNIVAQVKARGAHGVDLDFEIPGSSARARLTQFVHELRAAFSAEGNSPDGKPYRIHMALMPIDWANAYDIANFIGDLDYAMVMSYEGHSASSTQAGPTNKLYSPVPPWAQNFSYQYFFDHWLGKMGYQNAPKLLGGVGYYMQDFTTQN
ncbi:MAG TPA: glycoside hydrolase family 18 protein, partial [Turneriella sp.]|nr:glycoside hydrolase family 18 protein [Turneriella sp.]